jgi:hypothetical protein
VRSTSYDFSRLAITGYPIRVDTPYIQRLWQDLPSIVKSLWRLCIVEKFILTSLQGIDRQSSVAKIAFSIHPTHTHPAQQRPHATTFLLTIISYLQSNPITMSNGPSNGYPYQEGGVDPSDLGSGTGSNSPPNGVEIGVIIGVIVFVIIAVAVLFVWRSRKKASKDAEATATASSQPDVSSGNQPVPPPKDEDRGMSSADTKVAPSIEPKTQKPSPLHKLKLGSRHQGRRYDGGRSSFRLQFHFVLGSNWLNCVSS